METTVNGKTIRLIPKAGIEELYNKLVREMMDTGFIIAFGDSGHQGEIAHVDLKNPLDGSSIYRIWVLREYVMVSDHRSDRAETIKIVCKRYENNGRTLWMSEGEEITVPEVFYKLENSDVYCRDANEWMAINEITCKRGCERYVSKQLASRTDLPESFNKKVLPLIRKRKGYKSTRLCDIKKVTRVNGYGYTVHMEGKEINIKYKA